MLIPIYLIMDHDKSKYVQYSAVKSKLELWISNSSDPQRYSIHSIEVYEKQANEIGHIICCAVNYD